MNAAAPIILSTADRASAPRTHVTLTIIYVVSTIGMMVIVMASFIALLIGGGGGRHALFALVAGSLAFAALVRIQFVQWSAILLRKLRGSQ